MAQRGRKPKPTALKLLEGNPGFRPLNEKEPKVPKEMGLPECPAWLMDAAKEEWYRLAKVLSDMGVLTAIDMAAFAGYCQNFARWKEAEEFIAEHGSTFETATGYIAQYPQVNISSGARKDMLKFAAEFGLTPSSRSRIIANSDAGSAGTSDDPMESLLRNG